MMIVPMPKRGRSCKGIVADEDDGTSFHATGVFPQNVVRDPTSPGTVNPITHIEVHRPSIPHIADPDFSDLQDEVREVGI